jgi:hypothetical protein
MPLTTGTLQDIPANTTDEMTMITKTTHNAVIPLWPACWYSGRSGTTVGIGAALKGAAVGTIIRLASARA